MRNFVVGYLFLVWTQDILKLPFLRFYQHHCWHCHHRQRLIPWPIKLFSYKWPMLSKVISVKLFSLSFSQPVQISVFSPIVFVCLFRFVLNFSVNIKFFNFIFYRHVETVFIVLSSDCNDLHLLWVSGGFLATQVTHFKLPPPLLQSMLS